MRAVVPSLLVLGIVTVVSAQGPVVPPAKTPPKKDSLRDAEFPVIVKGCVRGNRLKLDPGSEDVAARYLGATEFVLEGPKETLRTLLRGHDGHEEEVTGTAIIPASEIEDRHIQTRRIGEKMVVTGGSGSMTPRGSNVQPVRLKVEAMAHVESKCGY